jgi:Cyclin, N-terminal domain
MLTRYHCVPCRQLMPETLFLTTNLIDRFLELKGVTRKNLQLVRTCKHVAPDPSPTTLLGHQQTCC